MTGYQVDLGSQYYTTLSALLVGAALCLIYDFFRIIRMLRRWSSVSVFFQDVLYWIIVSIAVYGMLLVCCNGVARFYPIASALCGFLVCRLTLSRLVMLASSSVIGAVKWVLCLLNRVAFAPVSQLFVIIGQKILDFIKKTAYFFKKLLKDKASIVYNHLKLHRRRNSSESE